jgi:hypothetical protein
MHQVLWLEARVSLVDSIACRDASAVGCSTDPRPKCPMCPIFSSPNGKDRGVISRKASRPQPKTWGECASINNDRRSSSRSSPVKPPRARSVCVRWLLAFMQVVVTSRVIADHGTGAVLVLAWTTPSTRMLPDQTAFLSLLDETAARRMIDECCCCSSWGADCQILLHGLAASSISSVQTAQKLGPRQPTNNS